jgi:SAM-dependent methyltransferase
VTDPVAHTRRAWDRQVELGNEWTVPVSADVVARARGGDWSVVLIGYEPVPRDWFPDQLAGADVLCLASGGGQQGPVLAAAGARVTVFDNSPRQLERDEQVAARDGLPLRTVLGDMRDLGAFPDASFDLVFHPDHMLEYSHTMADQLGGQLAAGFVITGFAEAPHHSDATAAYLPGYFATRAEKPRRPDAPAHG